eukprot:scaffold48_cov311-Pinguiococcus_pyrenoidosus.AAC.209
MEVARVGRGLELSPRRRGQGGLGRSGSILHEQAEQRGSPSEAELLPAQWTSCTELSTSPTLSFPVQRHRGVRNRACGCENSARRGEQKPWGIRSYRRSRAEAVAQSRTPSLPTQRPLRGRKRIASRRRSWGAA